MVATVIIMIISIIIIKPFDNIIIFILNYSPHLTVADINIRSINYIHVVSSSATINYLYCNIEPIISWMELVT